MIIQSVLSHLCDRQQSSKLVGWRGDQATEVFVDRQRYAIDLVALLDRLGRIDRMGLMGLLEGGR